MAFILTFIGIVILLLVCLALPPAMQRKSIGRFIMALLLSFSGIIIPILSFLVSAFLVPDWKGGCKYGWLDCFHIGKLALTPFVLWACAAFYYVQILYPKIHYRSWAVLGLFIGAVVSGACLATGLVVGVYKDAQWWTLIPIYTFVWYLILAIHAMRQAPQNIYSYLLTLLGSLPFWAASVIVSMRQYRALPDVPPDCFIVTAATHGHARLVGPFLSIPHRNEKRQANRQLQTFWLLEDIWRNNSPRSHRLFRQMYNRVGPIIAKNINTPWMADAVYLLLKPFELCATIIVALWK